MADDPNKRGGADRKRVSQQPHEQAYQKRKAKEESGRTSESNPASAKSARTSKTSSGGRGSKE
ncbi:MAG TPA: hypothetical protein VM935_02165 [Chitinophagaceae bacterium]|nr:hypothetical protein [Chitinophagaceae bacterium]